MSAAVESPSRSGLGDEGFCLTSGHRFVCTYRGLWKPHRTLIQRLRGAVERDDIAGKAHCLHDFTGRESHDDHARTRFQRLFRLADVLESKHQHRATGRVHPRPVPALGAVVPRVRAFVGQSIRWTIDGCQSLVLVDRQRRGHGQLSQPSWLRRRGRGCVERQQALRDRASAPQPSNVVRERSVARGWRASGRTRRTRVGDQVTRGLNGAAANIEPARDS